MNPSTAFAAVLADELARCGLREVVVAPGSRSTPLAMAFWDLEQAGRVRLHVRIDERSAAFTALGLAKVAGRPVAVLCTSGTAAANFHPAVIEADESAVPLLVLTADRPPELRGTGASQTIDQVKLYGAAVRWYAESGVPERRPGQAAYWRSLAGRAWAHAAGTPGTLPGPVHLNLPLRDPLVPDPHSVPPAAAPGTSSSASSRTSAAPGSANSETPPLDPGTTAPGSGVTPQLAPDQAPRVIAEGFPVAEPSPRPGGGNLPPPENAPRHVADNSKKRGSAGGADGAGGAAQAAAASAGAAHAGSALSGPAGADASHADAVLAGADWPDSLAGRPGGAPWTRVAAGPAAAAPLELPWAERGVVVCGDGDYDAAALVALAEQAGWPVLAEPSSGARRGPNALTGYQYLLAAPAFMRAYRPQVIVSAGRPGLTRPQSALLAQAKSAPGGAAAPEDAGTAGVRHVVLASGPGLWADPQRAATDVALAVRLTGVPGRVPGHWLSAWQRADAAATRAAGALLDAWTGDASDADGPARAGAVEAAAPGAQAPAPAGTRAGPGALSEPGVARELAAALPPGALLWCGNSLAVRDADLVLPPRADTRVIASRGVSGIDGTFSTAAGAALAHAAGHPGAVAFALIGDLSLLHDAPGLVIGPAEPRPDLCVVVVNNDGGGIFETLEPARFKDQAGSGPSVFERVFGTAHGASLERLAAAFGLPWTLAEHPGDLAKAVAATAPGCGPRIIEVRTDRSANAALRSRMRAVAVAAAEAATGSGG